MTKISEDEFRHICDGIYEDRESIIRNNPIGSREEILYWMLLSCLISYLSLEATETPCFTGTPDAANYRKAISHIITPRKTTDFDLEPYLDKLAVDDH